jgi:hypothetical protein
MAVYLRRSPRKAEFINNQGRPLAPVFRDRVEDGERLSVFLQSTLCTAQAVGDHFGQAVFSVASEHLQALAEWPGPPTPTIFDALQSLHAPDTNLVAPFNYAHYLWCFDEALRHWRQAGNASYRQGRRILMEYLVFHAVAEYP